MTKDYKVIDKNHLIDYWFPTGLGENSLCFHSLDLNKRSKPCEDCRVLDAFIADILVRVFESRKHPLEIGLLK